MVDEVVRSVTSQAIQEREADIYVGPWAQMGPYLASPTHDVRQGVEQR